MIKMTRADSEGMPPHYIFKKKLLIRFAKHEHGLEKCGCVISMIYSDIVTVVGDYSGIILNVRDSKFLGGLHYPPVRSEFICFKPREFDETSEHIEYFNGMTYSFKDLISWCELEDVKFKMW